MQQVFLCYSHVDKAEAEWLCDELRARGLKVWWDGEVTSDRVWASEVAQALDDSDTMIVLVTPDAMSSDLVLSEVRQAFSDHKKPRRILPLLLKPTYAVPWYFRKLDTVDATKDRESGIESIATAIRAA